MGHSRDKYFENKRRRVLHQSEKQTRNWSADAWSEDDDVCLNFKDSARGISKNGSGGLSSYWSLPCVRDDALLRREIKKVVPLFPRFKAQALSLVLHTLGMYAELFTRESGHSLPIETWKKIAPEWCAAMIDKLDDLEGEHFCNIFQGGMRLGGFGDPNFEERFRESSLRQVDQFSSETITYYLQTAARYQFRITEAIGQRLIERARGFLDDDSYKPFQRAISVKSFADLGVLPDKKFRKSFYAQARPMISSFGMHYLSHVIWSSAVSAKAPPTDFQRDTFLWLNKILLKSPEERKAYARDKSRELSVLLWSFAVWSAITPLSPEGVYTASVIADTIDRKKLRSGQEHSCYLAAKQLFPDKAGMFRPIRKMNEQVSPSEIYLSKRLARLGFVLNEANKEIEPLKTRTDYAFSLGAGRPHVLVEIDGCYHYADSLRSMPSILKGGAILMACLISKERLRDVFIRVPLFVANSLNNKQLSYLASSAAELKAGAYWVGRSTHPNQVFSINKMVFPDVPVLPEALRPQGNKVWAQGITGREP